MSQIMDFINKNGGKEMKFWINWCLGNDSDECWRPGRLAIKQMEEDWEEYDPFRGTDYKVIIEVARTTKEAINASATAVLIDRMCGNNVTDITPYYWKTEKLYTDDFMGYVKEGFVIPCKDYDDFVVTKKQGAEFLSDNQIVLHTWEELEPAYIDKGGFAIPGEVDIF